MAKALVQHDRPMPRHKDRCSAKASQANFRFQQSRYTVEPGAGYADGCRISRPQLRECWHGGKDQRN